MQKVGEALLMHRGMEQEGVTKFSAEHSTRELSLTEREAVRTLRGWRALLFHLGVIGKNPTLYDGAAYGNVSARVPPFPGERGARAFVVSCTQTGGAAGVDHRDFCVVSACSPRTNRVKSAGPCPPSSESLTHGALYDLSPTIRAVLHIHAPLLFSRAAELRLPTTDKAVAYGTPEMAKEMARLWRDTNLPDRRVLAMGGHQDGVVAFGATPNDAGQRLLTEMAAALAVQA